MIIDKNIGLKLIREYGVKDFIGGDFEYHTSGGGIFAVKDSVHGGKEIHLAFKPEFRSKSQSFIIDFCDKLDSNIWAFIGEDYSKTVNAAFRCGFKYIELADGQKGDGSSTKVHVMKRVKR